jgi:hypothetical protein
MANRAEKRVKAIVEEAKKPIIYADKWGNEQGRVYPKSANIYAHAHKAVENLLGIDGVVNRAHVPPEYRNALKKYCF